MHVLSCLKVLLAIPLLASSFAVDAQTTRKLHRIGMLEVVPAPSNASNLTSFREGLTNLGYLEGRDFVIEYRSADGQPATFSRLADELVRLGVDVVVTR